MDVKYIWGNSNFHSVNSDSIGNSGGLVNRWDGETIIMGDFNEVRSAGLIEVKMEGYSFTWSLPSASKMSKLDRFLAKTNKALVDKLVVIDKELDSGNVTDDILLTLLDLTRNLNAIKQADQLDMAQKLKSVGRLREMKTQNIFMLSSTRDVLNWLFGGFSLMELGLRSRL
nr:hypothetical protein [Tanacetum cinerariifolium]